MRWPMLHVMINTSRTHLLGETDNIRFDTKVLVAPHLSCGPAPSLDLVHHKGHIPFPGNLLQALEELWAAMVVSTLSLGHGGQ